MKELKITRKCDVIKYKNKEVKYREWREKRVVR